MKTSKIVLVIVAGLIIILLIVSLIVLRKNIGTLIEKHTFIEYKIVPIEAFASIEFSSNWAVQIKQGKDCKVELAVEEGSSLSPLLENKDEILYFIADTQRIISNTTSIQARVTSPFLYSIKAEGNTEILMKNFWSDSLTVILSDSSIYSGKNNDFTNIKFKASVNR